MRYAVPTLLIALGIFASTGARADFRAEFGAVKSRGDHDLSRIELAGEHMRVDAGQGSMLFDVASGKMLMLQHDRKQYMDMEQVAETASSALASAQAALANLPPEQREMLEKRLGDRMQGVLDGHVDVSVKPTGRRDRIGRYSCEIYSTTVNGRHVQDACLADAGTIGISATDQATLRRAFEKLKTLMNKMSAGLVKSPLSGMPTDKFPIEITHYASDGNATGSIRLQQVSQASIPASDFRIPAGYTERDMPGLPQR